MNWKERKVSVQTLVQCSRVRRRRGNENESRRNFSMKYFLKSGVDTFRVCKKMFGATLGLKETIILNWVKENILETENNTERENRKS